MDASGTGPAGQVAGAWGTTCDGPVFSPTRAAIGHTQLTAFMAIASQASGRDLRSWDALSPWAAREFRAFWRTFAAWTSGSLGLSGALDPVCVGDDCEHARFFPGLRLNAAQALLNTEVAGDDAPAVTAVHADGRRATWTRGALRADVMALAAALRRRGLRPGDRVAAVARNDDQAMRMALATMAVGATLSSVSPDMAAEAMADRLAPLAPRLLFGHAAPQDFDTGTPVPERLAAVAAALPSLEAVVLLDGVLALDRPEVLSLDDLAREGAGEPFDFEPFAFDHPLFIVFSSGTTGRPKCIVHGAGGTLLEQVKEHRLHTDLRPGDRLYFHTSCSWMMWNWQLATLASGVEVVTWDGPVASVDALWQLVARERVTVFGTSAPYLRMCEEAGLLPRERHDLRALRAILSTGSVLHDRQYHWVARAVGPLPLQSISGGTDILGCFVLGNPNLPVHAGEAQCRSLGLDVLAWDDGAVTAPGVPGQLVCAGPFPSRPLGLFGDTDGSRFHAAYFSRNEPLWSHGDLVAFSAHGGARLLGRVDGVLNVRGIKASPGEIEHVLQDQPSVREAMVVEQRGAEDTRTVGLLVLAPGVRLDAPLAARLRQATAQRLSPAHVPDLLLDVQLLPVTLNGKPSHAAARQAVSGLPAGNLAALRDPWCLDAIASHPGLRSDAPVPVPADDLVGQLQQAWSHLFAIPGLGPDADFFALGGSSLMAARLMAQVHAMRGVTLPLSTLLQAPTPARLAALLAAPAAQPLPTTVAVLRPGSGPGLFLVHGLSGTLLECHALVDALGGARPVYGFQARGLQGEPLLPPTVEAIATGYLEALRAVQPHGPYALCGYSFGGVVALEMARLLARAGEAVPGLFLLDTHLPRDLPPLPRLLSRLARGVRTLVALPGAQRRAYARAVLHRIAGARDAVLPGALPAPTGLSAAQQAVYAGMLRALAAYRPAPLDDVRVTYLRAAVPLGGWDDPLPAWRRVARGGLLTLRVPGGHLDLVAGQVHAVAALLDRELARDFGDAPVPGPRAA